MSQSPTQESTGQWFSSTLESARELLKNSDAWASAYIN